MVKKLTHFTVAGIQCSQSTNCEDPAKEHIIKIKNTLALYPFIQMVVLPELVVSGVDISKAQPTNAKLVQQFQILAKELGIWIVPGSFYEKENDKVYNVAHVLNPQGEVVVRAKKIYPFEPYETGVSSGKEVCIFDVNNTVFGLSICYDMWFPETTRAMVWQGAEIIIHPTLTPTIDRDLELSFARTNAALNQVYFFDINASRPLGAGQSVIYNFEGNNLYTAGELDEVIVIEADLTSLRRSRKRGIHNLGQPLKSFRDKKINYPQYQENNSSQHLEDLGKLEIPKLETPKIEK